MMYTLALSLFVTGLVSVHCDCEDSWTRYGDSCYFFGHDDLTFHDAQRFCEHFSSNLTDINSSAENSFLRGYLTDLRAPKHWIGLSDEVVEGVWKVFPDGTDPKFLDWGHNQPDQHKSANCAAIWASFGYHWVDEPCQNRFKPLCEKPANRDSVQIIG